MKNLQHEFLPLKDKLTMDEKTNRYHAKNVRGVRGRSLKTRKSEHLRNVQHCKKESNVAKHAWTYDHAIDLSNSRVIDSGSHRTSKTLES